MIVNFTGTNQTVTPRLKITNQPGVGAIMAHKGDVVSFGLGKKDKSSFAAKVDKSGEHLQIMPSIVKGIVKPIKDICNAFIEAPIPTGLVIATTAAVIHFLPIVGAALAVGICGLGAYKIASGTIHAIKEHKRENNKQANKELQEVGEGIFDVALTARAAANGIGKLANTYEVVAKASKEAQQGVNIWQKFYSFIKMIQQQEGIPKEVNSLPTLIDKIKKEGLEQLAILKESITNGKPVSVPQIEKLLENVNHENAGKAADIFEQIANSLKTDSATKAKLGNVAEWLKAGQVDKVLANKADIIATLNQGNIDTILKNPEILRVIRQFMSVTNPEEAGSFLRKVINGAQQERTAATIGSTAISADEDPNLQLK